MSDNTTNTDTVRLAGIRSLATRIGLTTVQGGQPLAADLQRLSECVGPELAAELLETFRVQAAAAKAERARVAGLSFRF